MEAMQEYINNNADPRANYYYGMLSPIPTAIISILYVIGVTIIGPILMRNRKPFKLNIILIWYNAFQVVFSAYVFYRLYKEITVLEKFSCAVGNQTSIYAAGAAWWYYISKFTEFYDTMFFIMRKKFNQVSVLHVFHHSVMPLVAWAGGKFGPCSTLIIFGGTNAFIHIIMYGYYLLSASAIGPKYQKALNKFKPYITIMQMVQFIYTIIHTSALLVLDDCPMNKVPVIMTLSVAISFLIMFSIFYKKTYNTKPQKKTR